MATFRAASPAQRSAIAIAILAVLAALLPSDTAQALPGIGLPVVGPAVDSTLGHDILHDAVADALGRGEGERIDGRAYAPAGTIAPAQSGFFSPVNDYCDDAPAGVPDTSSTYISEESRGIIFSTITCDPFTPASWGSDGFTAFFLNGTGAQSFDHVVAFFPDSASASGITYEVIRTPNGDDTSTWVGVGFGDAQQVAPDEFGAFLPPGVIPYSSFAFIHEAFTAGNSDLTPQQEEIAFGSGFHPNICTGNQFATAGHDPAPRTATIQGPTRLLDDAARLLAIAGLDTVDRNTDLGILGVSTGDIGLVTDLLDGLSVTVTPDLAYTTAQTTPNDPSYAEQWGLQQIGAPTAWAAGTGSPAAIAIIDTGIDGSHPDLTVRATFDAVNNRAHPNPTNNARGFHGTAVAGVTGALGNNGQFGTGVVWDSQFIAVNAFDAPGCSNSTWLATGIRQAVDAGADIINMSLGTIGTNGGDPAVDAAIDHAISRDVILVASTGNFGPGQGIGFPSSHPAVIAVGATDIKGTIAGYSATGPGTEIVAPGGGTSGQDNIITLAPGASTTAVTGTSFSAPYVTGAAALWLAVHPTGTAAQFRDALAVSATDLGTGGRDDTHGHGLLNLTGLISSAPPAGPADPATPTGNLRVIQGPAAADTAAAVAVDRFGGRGGAGATHAVIGRADVFADSLAGTALTGTGPLLYTATASVPTSTFAALGDLPAGSTVYLLGGTAAISPAVAEQVTGQGLNPVRLSGASRITTALAIADEVRSRNPASREVAIARADNWADSVTAGAWAARTGHPIIITSTASLDGDVADWLATRSFDRIHVLGGTAAISDTTFGQIQQVAGDADVRRIAGASRDATAAAIADILLPTASRATVIAGFADTGCIGGLAAGGYGASTNSALFPTGDTLPATTRDALGRTATCADTLVVQVTGQLAAAALGEIGSAARC